MKSKIFTIVGALVLALLIGVGCSESPAPPANPTLIPTPTAPTPTATPTPEPLGPPVADSANPVLSDTDIEIYHELRDASQSVSSLHQTGAEVGQQIVAEEDTLACNKCLVHDISILGDELCHSEGNLMDKATDIRLRHAASRLGGSLYYLWLSLNRAEEGELEAHNKYLAKSANQWEMAQDLLDSFADDLE